jgi:xanthine/uracil permease
MLKPVSLIYGVDDIPPLLTTIILGIQHASLMSIAIIFPVILVNGMGSSISSNDARAFVSLSLPSGRIITILQALKYKNLGSGYLCPALSGPSYLNPSILAASLGGLPLVFGMTAFNGAVEIVFSRILHKLRAMFPPEVTGTVVALVGIVVIPVSMRNFIGVGLNDTNAETPELLVGIITLVTMIGLNVFSRGIFVDGLGGVIPGLIGGFGQSTSSSNIGMSTATGATSRVIAYSAGLFFILLAFFPKLADIFIIMPKPVMGALLIFSVSFMIVQGLQMIMSRMLDARKIFVVGISFILGLSVDMVPEIYKNIHPYFLPIFSSSLSLGAVSAVILNLFLRIGIKAHANIQLNIGASTSEQIFIFMEKQGQLWGARKEIITKASYAFNEVFEMVVNSNQNESTIDLTVRFNEPKIEAKMEYTGKSFELPGRRPSTQEIEDPKNVHLLSGFLLTKYCDKIKVSEKNGNVTVKMFFEH